MKKRFQMIPPGLQKEIIIRIAASAVSVLVLVVAAVLYREFYICISFLLFAAVFAIAGITLFIRSCQGRYVALEGICRQIERTSMRRRPKAIYLSADPHMVKVYIRQRLKNLKEGDGVIVYVSDTMPVYQQEGCEVLNGYLAMEIRKGAEVHE